MVMQAAAAQETGTEEEMKEARLEAAAGEGAAAGKAEKVKRAEAEGMEAPEILVVRPSTATASKVMTTTSMQRDATTPSSSLSNRQWQMSGGRK